MLVAVTGSNGFVGRRVCASLAAAGHLVRPIVRSAPSSTLLGPIGVGDIHGKTEWLKALDSVDCVVHCAARVHVLNDPASDPLAAFREVNLEGSRNLAHQAAQAGVKRLVFLSSLKVLGEVTPPGHPFDCHSQPQPTDPYSRSKWEAEMALHEISAQTGLETTVIRPPLVYGPGVRANFLTLVRAVAKGIPLPLGRVQNQRSLIGLSNLCDVIALCVDHPNAAGGAFLVSDGTDVSTPELVRAIAQALERQERLVPIPLSWLSAAGGIMGKQGIIDRLCGTLQVDIGHTMESLDWTPRFTLQDELRMLAKAV